MTDAPTKSRRGGARPGAGRKPKAHRSPTALSKVDVEAAMAADVPEEIDSVAATSSRASIAALVNQLLGGSSDSARLDAAFEILDRGWGKPTVEAGGHPMLPFLGRAPIRSIANEVRDEARRHGRLAIMVLERIQSGSDSESCRVRAAKGLLARGVGATAPARLPPEIGDRPTAPLGKKEEAQRQARLVGSSGRFAPLPPPRLPN